MVPLTAWTVPNPDIPGHYLLYFHAYGYVQGARNHWRLTGFDISTVAGTDFAPLTRDRKGVLAGQCGLAQHPQVVLVADTSAAFNTGNFDSSSSVDADAWTGDWLDE